MPKTKTKPKPIQPSGFRCLEIWAGTNPAYRFKVEYKGVSVGETEPTYVVQIWSIHSPKVIWAHHGPDLYVVARYVISRSALWVNKPSA